VELCLVVANGLHGVTSQLVRRRVVDAYALTRKAIEVVGVARRASESRELLQTFLAAYPNVSRQGDPTQYRR